jgi:Rrf2 family protein
MAVNTQFSIAVHILAASGCCRGEGATTGKFALSVNTSPSFVRRVVSKLSKAGLLKTTTGKSGSCGLAKDAKMISLLDIYRAVDAPKAFSIHNYPEQKPCLVSCHIKASLEKALKKTQKAMEESLSEISLASIVTEVNKK